MTDSPDRVSTAFDLFHRSVQKWVWDQNWTELHDIQERAARPILGRETDVVIAAATAGGKTEAAFLPIASVLASLDADERRVGVDVLYVSPLKALINDQYDRLRDLFEFLGVPVHRWHGDVPSSRKQKVVQNPDGVLLITPESLEAQFIRRGSRMPHLLRTLQYVVVDELHAFIGSERGRQLQSLLHRVELAARRRVPRVALSATLGDMDLACDFLRPGSGGAVHRVISDSRGSEVRLQIRGYEGKPPGVDSEEANRAEREGRKVSLSDTVAGDALDVARDLFGTLRGGRHIVFANRRADVEGFTDLLRELCEQRRVPDEFWPHHGSLNRTLREDAEKALKEGSRPATILATTTLELGIDVGQVETIVQLGPPPSVASMRQRLGRSGRRAEDPSVLRIYIQERRIDPETPPQNQIRSSLVQAVAMVRLLVERWYEPPPAEALHLSTLVQQVLSLLAQYGAVSARDAYRVLCADGPFASVSGEQFTQLLRDLAAHELIKQVHTGNLVLDLGGERLVNHYEFYAAFHTPDEYRIIAGSTTLGSLPILYPLYPGVMIIFGGRRWRVVDVDDQGKVVDVRPAAGGRPPAFGGAGALVHRRVREEMKCVYEHDAMPPFLDAGARQLLEEGREAFRRLDLAKRSLVRWGNDTLFFPWTGDRELNTLLLQFQGLGLEVAPEGLALLFSEVRPENVRSNLRPLVEAGPANAKELAAVAQNKRTEKHHYLLRNDLLTADYATGRLDSVGAYAALRRAPEVKIIQD